jgi:hypothetical protein
MIPKERCSGSSNIVIDIGDGSNPAIFSESFTKFLRSLQESSKQPVSSTSYRIRVNDKTLLEGLN